MALQKKSSKTKDLNLVASLRTKYPNVKMVDWAAGFRVSPATLNGWYRGKSFSKENEWVGDVIKTLLEVPKGKITEQVQIGILKENALERWVIVGAALTPEAMKMAGIVIGYLGKESLGKLVDSETIGNGLYDLFKRAKDEEIV
jgi:hypothetical protein